MYGYNDDNAQTGSGIVFGLNPGITKLVKFEYNPNGGTGGTELECLDIVFNVNGKDVSFRQFPVTKAFGDNDEIIDASDYKHPKVIEAFADFGSLMTHIMTCFMSKEDYILAMKDPISNFKLFCNKLESLLPKDFSTIPLDIFFQYQWTITKNNQQTFLVIPNKTKHGKFLCPSVVPTGSWKEIRVKEPSNQLKNALYYKDDDGNIHPFVRTGWFMNSRLANQQKEETSIYSNEESNMNEELPFKNGSTTSNEQEDWLNDSK